MSLSETWARRLRPDALRRLGLGLAVGAAGGLVGDWLGVPLAWMLGALFFCMFASLARAPVEVPLWMRAYFLALIGLFLGESFDRLSLAELIRWPISILAAMLYVPVAASVAYLFYRHVAREAAMTSVCAAIPGGLTAVVTISAQLGADERDVALAQSLRIAIVIGLAPLIAFGILGLIPPDEVALAARPLIGLQDGVILVAASLAAIWVAVRAGLPVPQMMAPLLASAVLRMAGVVEGALPYWMAEVALVVTGSSIGTRFHGVRLGRWFRVALITAGGTAVLMAVSAVFAIGVSAVTGVDYLSALLAFAPGGVAEMSLIAIAIDADPGFVAVHHIVRISFILLAVPFFGLWLKKRVSSG